MPFRSSADAVSPAAASEVVRDAVAHMVRQFADPFAFYRELVQNSIDAGATAIDVRIHWEPGDDDRGVLRVTVGDDGCGMSLDIIERCLLVVFRSSKEGDKTKIGKFGVGFFSIFAVAPELVIVDTGRGEDGLRVRIAPDHSYEIERTAVRKGTAVTLLVAMERERVDPFVESSVAALEKWCPHVEVPLNLVADRVQLVTREAQPNAAGSANAANDGASI